MKQHEAFKALIALNISFGCIKKVILEDITETISVVNKAKHIKYKTIKRREHKLETVYTTLQKKKFFWLDILFLKKNLDLMELTIEPDPKLMDDTIKYLENNLTNNLKLNFNKKEWIITKIKKDKKTIDIITEEYKYLKGEE